MKNWWLYKLTVTDRTNIVCFCITMTIIAAGMIIVKKVHLNCWKIQIGILIIYEIVAVLLLTVRLLNG